MNDKLENSSDFIVGDNVIYIPHHADGDERHPDCEAGIVSSVNDKFVFVKYKLNHVNGIATLPTDLIKISLEYINKKLTNEY